MSVKAATPVVAKELPFYVDVNQRDLATEFKASNVLDKEWKNTAGPLEADFLASSGANALEAGKNLIQAGINAGNIPVGAVQVGAAAVYKVVAGALNTLSFTANAAMSLKDGLFYTLDANFRDEVKSMTPDQKKVAFVHFNAMKRALTRYATIFGKDEWKMFGEGVKRLRNGIALTAKELASTTKNVADALLEVSAAALIGLARPVAIAGLGVAGGLLKSISWVAGQLKKLMGAIESGSDKLGTKAWDGANALLDGYDSANFDDGAKA